MRFHWQNLNEYRRGKETVMGALWRHGRAWLGSWGWEWIILRDRCELSLAFGHHGESIGGHFSIPFLLTVHLHRNVRWIGQREREFKFSLSPTEFWWRWWGNPNESNPSRDRWWQRLKIVHLGDLLFGRREYVQETLETRDILIPLPEGCYEGKWKLQHAKWWRPRFPFWPLTIERWDSWIDVPEGIPFQGKGENDWDCGDDGLFGAGCSSQQEPEVVAQVVKRVLESRKRYGTTGRVRQAGVVMARDRMTTT